MSPTEEIIEAARAIAQSLFARIDANNAMSIQAMMVRRLVDALAAYDAQRAAQRAVPRDVPVCAHCGSTSVSAEVTSAHWNVHTQTWEVTDICDKGHYCADCERETDLRWRPAAPEEMRLSPCGHSACSQHYIDTGSRTCVQT